MPNINVNLKILGYKKSYPDVFISNEEILI